MKTKTIEERAKEYAQDPFLAALERKAYIAGATEQKAIDMDRSCEWLKGVQCVVHPQIAYGFAEEFRKAMEE